MCFLVSLTNETKHIMAQHCRFLQKQTRPNVQMYTHVWCVLQPSDQFIASMWILHKLHCIWRFESTENWSNSPIDCGKSTGDNWTLIFYFGHRTQISRKTSDKFVLNYQFTTDCSFSDNGEMFWLYMHTATQFIVTTCIKNYQKGTQIPSHIDAGPKKFRT